MQNKQIKDKTEVVRNYAIRRVNPFRGVMQVIESEEGRALSCNGVVWEILVRATKGNTSDMPADHATSKTYYRFGLWSMGDGLMKRSNSPAAGQDYFELMSKCETLVDRVQARHDQLPFQLEDSLELWLFDSDSQRPFALLSSSLPDSALPSAEAEYWSACIGANGSPAQRRFPQAHELEEQVSTRAGLDINRHWVQRLPGGEGIVVHTGRAIPADHFPLLLLDENWQRDEEQQRAREYIKWISPSLLTLQHLDKDARVRLENNLNVQAISIEHHWHLYPEIINSTWLKAARVQCRIESCR
jgi:hypothetical protein